jgi:hypothetical protein
MSRAIGIVVFAIAGLLLTSIGGAAIAAAPLTLPALFALVRMHPTRAFRIVGALLGGLTAAEVVWAAVYVVFGEDGAAIWLVPLVAGVLAGYVMQRTTIRVPA